MFVDLECVCDFVRFQAIIGSVYSIKRLRRVL